MIGNHKAIPRPAVKKEKHSNKTTKNNKKIEKQVGRQRKKEKY